MPTQNSKKLTEQKFNTIATQANNGRNSTEKVALANGVKPSTVKAIRQCATWGEYQRRKAAKVQQMKAARELDQITKENPISRRPVMASAPAQSTPWWMFWRKG